jgi:NADH:ubiquinone oxidoreductase subunit F (NADH-binding)
VSAQAATTRGSVDAPLPNAPGGLPRLLLGVRDDRRPARLPEHLDVYGPNDDARSGDELASLLERSGLTGRGGAAFPVADKLRAVAGMRARPVVLVNGAEGEPASGKDRALLGTVPHLMLDGAVLAAEALGARDVVVAVRAGATLARSAVAAAVKERTRTRGRPGVSIRVAPVPNGLIVGEETALVGFLNGRAPKPTFTPPRPFERGIGGAPTLVQNVETFAQIALIARFGVAWFRELGTSREPGSTLVTVSGAVRRPGVHEIELGTSLASVVEEAGGLTAPVSAYLVGGYFGTWLRAADCESLPLLEADLSRNGASLGARAIVALPADTCALGEVARVTRYLADESAGQCGPCINGLAAIADSVERLAAGIGDDRVQLARWVDVVRGRGACRHPDGTTRFVASALAVFAGEVETHLRYGRCSSRLVGALPVPARTGRS